MQFADNGLWSAVSQSASAEVRTDSAEVDTSYANELRIDTAYFDTTSMDIVVLWHTDTTVVDSFLYGVTHTLGESCAVSAPATWTDVPQSAVTGDTLRIDKSADARFDTVYTVCLWYKKQDTKEVVPTDASTATVPVGAYTWQLVQYFEGADTVSVFNNTVRLWPEVGITYSGITDTLQYRDFGPLAPVQTRIGSPGIVFADPANTPAFYIGLQYDPDTLGSDVTVDQIGLYRYTPDGFVRVPNAEVDAGRNLVYVKTSNLSSPYVVLADVSDPDTAFVSPRGAVAAVDVSMIYDTLVLSDNMAGVQWWFYHSTPDKALYETVKDSGVVSGTMDTLILGIPVSGVRDNGVRAALVIDDGVYRDTVDMSHQALRSNTDAVYVPSKEWYPLHVTSQLTGNTDSVSAVMQQLLGSDGWSYDTMQHRLFVWRGWEGNAAEDEKWVQYTPGDTTIDRFFSFTPGNVVWFKSREVVEGDFGSGITLSLDDTATIALQPGWNDIANPYGFDVMLWQILEATGPRATLTDSLEFYRWRYKDERYISEPIYVVGIPGLSYDDPDYFEDITLHSSPDTAYTVYNALDTTVMLRIPPSHAASAPRYDAPGKRVTSEGGKDWHVVVRPWYGDSTAMAPVYCVYNPELSKPRYCAMPPGFGKVTSGVVRNGGRRIYGHAIQAGADKGGCTYEVVFENRSDRTTAIGYAIEGQQHLPEGYYVSVIDPIVQDDAASMQSSLTLGENTRGYRWVVVGDAAYHRMVRTKAAGMQLALHRCYPNPVRTSMRIRFSLPYAGIEKVDFQLFDVLGRCVWHRRLDAASMQPGMHSIAWTGKSTTGTPLSAGMYVLRMSARGHAVTGRLHFERKIIYAP
jgi:hypothetical protein